MKVLSKEYLESLLAKAEGVPSRMNLQLFAEPGGEPDPNPNPDGGADPKPEDKPLTMEQIQKMIQSETDKVRTEYSQKLKDAKAEADRLAKEKMTEEEKAEFERKRLQEELTAKEQALLERELNLQAIDLLTEAKMPLAFKDFVVGAGEEVTKAKVKTLKALWSEALENAVKERFKESGRTPHEPDGGDTTKNPWSKEHFNLTEQARILRENPELAATLRQMAR